MTTLSQHSLQAANETDEVWRWLRSPALMAAAVFVISAIYYALCLYPGLGGELNPGDSAKFQVLGHTQIMMHGPGYPFVLLLGSVVRALNLPFEPWWTMTVALSVVPGAIANAMAFLIAHRLSGNALLALAAALLAGTSSLMVVQATEAEVYALNIAFLLTTLYLLLVFIETRRPAWFVAACAVYAVSFGDHLMMIFLLPLFVWLTALNWRIVLRPGIVAAILGFILLGASQYVYLGFVAHDPATRWSEYMPLQPTVWELIGYIAGIWFKELYGSGFDNLRSFDILRLTMENAHPSLSAPLAGLGFVLFLLGWRLENATWRGMALLFGAAICFLPFMIGYGAGDIQAFHLPFLTPVLIAAVIAIGWMISDRPVLVNAVAIVLVVVGISRAAEHAERLRAREAPMAGLKEALIELVALSRVEKPIVALSYPLRMASMYYEYLPALPQSALYVLDWKAPGYSRGLDEVGGVVMPTAGHRVMRWIEGAHLGMHCRIEEDLALVQGKWPAYTFSCTRNVLGDDSFEGGYRFHRPRRAVDPETEDRVRLATIPPVDANYLD